MNQDLSQSSRQNPGSRHQVQNSQNQSYSGQKTPRGRFIGTQIQRRIKFDKNSSSQNILSNISENDQSFTQDKNHDTLFGTNIALDKTKKKLEDFILTFKDGEQMELEETKSHYIERLDLLKQASGLLLNIDGNHLFDYDKELYYQLINFPSDIIMIFDQVINTIFESMFDGENCWQIEVSILNLKKNIRVRELNPKDIHHLIQIKGIVIRCSEIYPEMREAMFLCSNCGQKQNVPLNYGRIQEPSECIPCKGKFSYQIQHNQCTFIDKQYVKLQETPETVPDGETPQTVNLLAFGTFVDQVFFQIQKVRPGDRIDVVGIYRATGTKQTTTKRTLKSIYKTYIDVISYKSQAKRYSDNEGMNKENEQEYFAPDLVQELKNIASNEKIYDNLVNSIAPSIWGNDDLKKGILCMLFGGTFKEFSQSGKGRFRADINCLMIGDPSTAKSQMLTYVNRIAPRGIYTSGKGSSAVGLTAYITKDPETNEFILESGALVLSDKGVCCIDEFDKMDENTRTILHEAMEQQTISIAKAGIVCSLNARTSILASANPVESRYNPKLSVIQNIKLPPSLLSRFDLIYLMLDNINEAQDRRLASHILTLYSNNYRQNNQSMKPIIENKLLTKYISYAKQRIFPVLSNQACDDLVTGYKEMRKLGMNKNIITATPRQLESLIRLSEALAKMRFSEIVERKDVQEAIRLISVATQSAATDPVTGVIDMDVINTGISAGLRQKIDKIREKLMDFIDISKETMKAGIKYDDLRMQIEKMFQSEQTGEQTFNQDEFLEAINRMTQENILRKEGPLKKPKFIKLGNK